MSLRLIPIDAITLENIEQLEENGVTESQVLDYKTLILLDSDHKKEGFLNDITSFANANGGELIVGVQEEQNSDGRNTGLIGEICGVPTPDFTLDSFKLRATQLMRTEIEPIIPNVQWSNELKTEYGQQRHVLTRQEEGVYFRGAEAMTVDRDATWMHSKQSFYVKHGDWFVALCVVMPAWTLFLFFQTRKNGKL